VGDLADELVRKVRAAAASRRAPASAEPRPVAETPPPMQPRELNPRQVVLLGASTGGTEALKEVITRLPADMPGLCIVQHIPAYFSGAFAERLNALSALEVREARDGDAVRSGLALVAPGDFHMLLRRRGEGYCVQLKQGPKVWHQRPAVDVLFGSAAEIVGEHAVAGVLTGMGHDGAEGLLKLRNAGARTFAQDEKSCVVFGMPRVAMELGAAERMIALPDIARHLQLLTVERAALSR
jgi:two-component system chemotaxis response regulator CheB